MASRNTEPNQLVGIWLPPERADLAWLHGRVALLVETPEPDVSNVKSEDDLRDAMICIVELETRRASVPTEYVFDPPDSAKVGDVFAVDREVTVKEGGQLSDTAGVAVGDGYEISFGGACPVQGDGFVDGCPCYYRSRGKGWSLEIWALTQDPQTNDPVWSMHRAEYVWPDGGWLRAEISVKNIERAVAAYREFLKAGTP